MKSLIETYFAKKKTGENNQTQLVERIEADKGYNCAGSYFTIIWIARWIQKQVDDRRKKESQGDDWDMWKE